MRLFLLFLVFFSFVTKNFNAFSQTSDKPEVVLTTGHNDQINALTISNDGRFLVSAGNNKIVKIWEVGIGMEYRTLSGTNGRVDQLCFSPDNIHLAAI